MSCVRGYLSRFISLAGYEGVVLALDCHLDSVQVFQQEVLRRPPAAPHWNLDVVLKALCLPPYKPLDRATFRDLTRKTAFLLSLATAHRVSELQAFSNAVSFQQGDAILAYLPEFVAKTETSTNILPREVRVKSLSSLEGRRDEERL